MVPVCDKRYHIYNRFRHFWAEIKKLWNYPFRPIIGNVSAAIRYLHLKSSRALAILILISSTF